jgi:hypothetical protein
LKATLVTSPRWRHHRLAQLRGRRGDDALQRDEIGRARRGERRLGRDAAIELVGGGDFLDLFEEALRLVELRRLVVDALEVLLDDELVLVGENLGLLLVLDQLDLQRLQLVAQHLHSGLLLVHLVVEEGAARLRLREAVAPLVDLVLVLGALILQFRHLVLRVEQRLRSFGGPFVGARQIGDQFLGVGIGHNVRVRGRDSGRRSIMTDSGSIGDGVGGRYGSGGSQGVQMRRRSGSDGTDRMTIKVREMCVNGEVG